MQDIDLYLKKLSIPKNRGLLLISNPGQKGDSNYAPTTNKVIEHYKQYFMSIWGGCWSEELDDIQVVDEIHQLSKSKIKSIIEDFNGYEYSIVVFCGHGGISDRSKQPFIQLPNGELLKQSDIIGDGIEDLRRLIIFDCCRTPASVPDFLLEKLFAEKPEAFQIALTKDYYTSLFKESEPHVEVIHSTQIGKYAQVATSIDTLFSKSLFETIEDWKAKCPLQAGLQNGKCCINYSHLSGDICEKMKKHNQLPEFVNYGDCRRLFPLMAYINLLICD